jgi:hypothetical protein
MFGKVSGILIGLLVLAKVVSLDLSPNSTSAVQGATAPTMTAIPTVEPTVIPTDTPVPTVALVPIRRTHVPDTSVPAGASALCADGTYSFSMNHRGTCSHHGGVTQWL